jgi:hypothetical protein
MNSAKVYLMQPVMQKQEDPFNLRGLPMVEPPQDGWPGIETVLRQDKRRRTTRRYAGAALAAAATVTLVLGLALRQPLSPPAEQSLAQAQPALTTATGEEPSSSTDTLDSMITLSQRLEGRLRTIRAGMGDLPARSVVYQVELEDLIVQVDEELSIQPDSLSLWSQRVDLLMNLERLYENNLRRDYQQMASL